jgi:uncharacterized protein (DUF305 family)
MEMTNMTKGLIAAAAVAIALVAGAVGFAIGQSDDDHMGGSSWMGDMPGISHGGHHGGSDDSWAGPRMQMGAMPGMSMGDRGMVLDEAAFIAMMIPHHEMALDMAEAAIENGEDPEVRRLARAVVDEQRREIAQMRSWYLEWYGQAPPVMPMSGAMAMMGMAMDHTTIATADDPDREFLRLMIPHHAGAILMADMLLAGEPRDELAQLAREIIAAQSREIGDMQEARERIAPPLG